ncbi:MAG: alcohol dehydrogenase catalytic domain-containing protein [Lachnospiraceae bacterium]|nr:alcohol dehydrogenase catalytic domain-containing protein [Lachnospiraceae bacterium]
MKFKAAVIYKPGDPFEFQEVEMDDEPRDDEVLVKIHASSICHSDEYVRSAGVAIKLPAILGHEGAGVVQKVGSKVTKVKPGDHVIMTTPHCGECENCKKGKYTACVHGYELQFGRKDKTARIRDKNGNPLGQMMGQGSFGEYTMVFESSCVKVDPEIPFDIVAPVGCGFTTGTGTVLNYLKPKPDDVVAVYGLGSTGTASLMGAVLAGCKTIIAVSRSDKKLELAKKLGATHLINRTKIEEEKGHQYEVSGPEGFLEPIKYPVTDAVKDCTGGRGVDYAIVTAPVDEVAIPAIKSLATYGECCITASLYTVEAPTQRMQAMNTKISSCGMGDANKYEFFPYILEQYKKGNYPIDLLLTHYSFEDINQAFRDMEDGIAVKPVMEWKV